jgi:hypothetical protein
MLETWFPLLEVEMGTLVGGGNAILLLLTGMAIASALVIAFLASRRHKRAVARSFLGGAAILAVAYASGVIAASAVSTEKTLAPGETKWFCGFYIDCHLGLSVDRSEVLNELAGPNGPVRAEGRFHVLTLGLHNSAVNPGLDMLLYRPNARIVDALGRTYSRSAEREAAIASSGRPGVLGEETKVPHEPLKATIVFDLPANVQAPRLIVTEGWIVNRAIELGLINDENSIFHQRTYQALSPADDASVASTNQ